MQLCLSNLSVTRLLRRVAAGGGTIAAIESTYQQLFSGQRVDQIDNVALDNFASSVGQIMSVNVQTTANGGVWETQSAEHVLPAGVSVRAAVEDSLGNARNFLIADGVEPAITAVVTPTASRLYAGQSLSALPDFATHTQPENFTIHGAPAQASEVAILYTGDAQDAQTSLLEGQSGGYTVVVSNGSVQQQFEVPPVSVEYALRVTVADAQLELDMNALLSVDTDALIRFTAPSPYDAYDVGFGVGVGRYNRTLASLGPAQIFAPAISGGTAPGAVLTAINGLYHGDGDGGDIQHTGQWHDESGAIPGETGAILTGTQTGKTYSYVETLSDANGTRVYVSNQLTIGE